MNDEQSAMVHIKRAFRSYGIAAFNVLIDDKKVGNINNGKEVWFGVTAGRHVLRLKQMWADVSETVVFEVKPGDTVRFECSAKLTLKFPFAYLTKTGETEELQVKTQSARNKPDITVKFLSEYEKMRVASEEVEVPHGVTIRVKRSRTVEHVIEMGYQNTTGITVDAGILNIVNTSIQGEIQRKQNKAYRQTETVEYEIELNGNTTNRYELIWVDVWQKGIVEVKDGNIQMLSFQIRERTELQVIPIT